MAVRSLVGVLACLALSLSVAPAAASFPGANGPLLINNQLVSLDGDAAQLPWGASYGKFSPDGASIAYVEHTDDFYISTVRVRRNTGADLSVPTPPGAISEVSWAPDGRQLAAHVTTSGGDNGVTTSIYRLSLDGSPPAHVYSDSRILDGADWRPGGNVIAFVRNGGSDVFTVSAAGGALTNLTGNCTYPEGENYADCSGSETTYSFSHLEWSPDGRRLAMSVNESNYLAGTEGVYLGLLTVGAKTPGKLVTIPRYNGIWTSPESAWAPDGNSIAFGYEPSGSSSLGTYVVPVTGGTPTKVSGFGLRDWQPCPNSTCASWVERDPSTITMTYRTGRAIRVGGVVSPAHPGHRVVVVLAKQRRDGTWARIATKRPTLDAASAYSTRFKRPSASLCRLTARFPGDADHKPSKVVKRFSC